MKIPANIETQHQRRMLWLRESFLFVLLTIQEHPFITMHHHHHHHHHHLMALWWRRKSFNYNNLLALHPFALCSLFCFSCFCIN